MYKRTLNHSINKAITYLLSQQQNNFIESFHQITFPVINASGYPVFETHKTNLFQRAIAIEALLQAKSDGFSIAETIIIEEVKNIIQQKHPLVKGGWSYMPQLLDFPPDLDDLGAILQIAAKVSNNDLNIICNDAILFVFNTCVNEDGSIPTWILDNEDDSDATLRINKMIQVIGGGGIHIEVMANFLEGLMAYDKKEVYKQKIYRSAQYIRTLQNTDFSWPSKWYWGQLYGTYKVANVLVKFESEAYLNNIFSFFLLQQNKNGSWGAYGGNALETSFAVLTLLNAAKEKYAPQIFPAVHWLINDQLDDGCWLESRFIKMETRNGTLSYGSKTISTAFVLKALIKSKNCSLQF